MRSFTLFTALVAYASSASAADQVYGAAEGFAKGVTGGGSATPVYPTTNAELVSYLGDSSARVIVLTKTYATSVRGYLCW
jgi:pectin lyase